ncbi:MAG: SDR family oxidoreductase [Candidatus Latescibacteria bacterium]|nr:SDR family oxidoreductase [Candidatus Latescibacterota bacterium]
MRIPPPVGLVTGGARGIGLAIARLWAERGASIAVVDRDPAGERAVKAASGGAPVAYYEADVRDHARALEVVADAASRLGGLDYVALNAGVTRDRVSWKMSEEEWDEVIGVNLKGAFNYVRAAAPILRARKSGAIVFVSSINGLRGKFGQSNYAASKAALIGLARSLALELGPSGVTVNVVAPGMVRTDMTADLPGEALERARAESPLRRIAEPEDVARAVCFLCGPEARHVTGAVLRVDGGQAMACESA